VVDEFTERYADLVTGSYDCVDRIVLNAYYPLGHSPGGFRVWWRRLHNDSDELLDNNHLMRFAGRFARRVRAWAAANGVPVIDCKAGERKHEIAEGYLRGWTYARRYVAGEATSPSRSRWWRSTSIPRMVLPPSAIIAAVSASTRTRRGRVGPPDSVNDSDMLYQNWSAVPSAGHPLDNSRVPGVLSNQHTTNEMRLIPARS
jgi:hypothetical protein